MKRLMMTAAIVLAIASPAHAEPATCDDIANFAEATATAHQNGTSLSVALAALEKHDIGSMRDLVIAIYSMPRYSSARAQKYAIADVRNTAHLACLRRNGA